MASNSIKIEISSDGDVLAVEFPDGQVLSSPTGNLRDAGTEIGNVDILSSYEYVLLQLRDRQTGKEIFVWRHPFCFYFKQDPDYVGQQAP